ncbi:MAG: peptidylprolyl isomerase [Acidobacteriota bacterium]|nr:MAG: peptidylprolyl isomerase [Acidobacteriota bacterium]
MKRKLLFLVLGLTAAFAVPAQVPDSELLEIVKAEDARTAGPALVALLKDKRQEVRERAALALGRIGDEGSVPEIEKLLSDPSGDVAVMTAFALGEIESPKAADSILAVLKNEKSPNALRAAAVEAAGKIAAANSSDESSKRLGEAILDALEVEARKGDKHSKVVILAGLTAALRARADETEIVVAKFFTNKDARIRADAANAYSRVRGKSANKQLQTMLLIDEDPVARANAARALGAASDKTALNMLLDASESDDDLRVRVSAMRSVGQISEPATADRVKKRLEAIFAAYKNSKEKRPSEQNELLEAVSALGRLLSGTSNSAAIDLLKDVSKALNYEAPEVESAIAGIDPKGYWPYLDTRVRQSQPTWKAMSTAFGSVSSIADELKKPENKEARSKMIDHFRKVVPLHSEISDENRFLFLALPSFVQMLADLEPEDADALLQNYLKNPDAFVRAAAASAIGDRPASVENVNALIDAYKGSLETDKDYNDAQMSILSALVKLDKHKAKPSLALALRHYDHLVRLQALRLIETNHLNEDFPDAEAQAKGVQKYHPKTYSKLGQVLNTEEDYRRALSRKNGTVFAVLTTAKGSFEIEFFPEEAPLTVDNFVKLAEKGYFNGIDIHRVVANFVVQDGDPRGDGNGGPGWSIRCEINRVPYERGMVGMALSGKDTGGSQWFVTHSPQPHLDGGYTVFGKVSEEGMMIVDRLVRGDTIEKIEIETRK